MNNLHIVLKKQAVSTINRSLESLMTCNDARTRLATPELPLEQLRAAEHHEACQSSRGDVLLTRSMTSRKDVLDQTF